MSARPGCPAEEELAALVEGRLDAAEESEIHRHIRGCDSCRRVFASLGDAMAPDGSGTLPSSDESMPGPGDRVGRFVLTRLVGVGGMGAVWEARDPGLARAVAIKLVRPGPGSGGDARKNRRRLLHEAKAMANLAHPNVVPVFEVGELGDQLFVVMEFIEGETLSKWLERAHSLDRLLAVFVAAGEGLAAAHAAEIVHRDFKPDNVMMGKDGRPRVTDFGLARTPPSMREPLGSSQPWTVSRNSGGAHSTARVLLGTPAYMAPEQLDGRSASIASDLFSYCTALYEALYRTRPFSGSTLGELRASMAAGQLRIPSSPRLTAELRALLLRGLAEDPRARPASMSELLRALRRVPAIRRRRRMVGIAFAVVLAAGAAVWFSRVEARSDCRDSDQRFAGLWDEARQRQIKSAFESTQLAYATDALHRVSEAFDHFRATWTSNYSAACEASATRQEDDSIAYLRMACLTQQLAAAQAKSDLFAHADEKLVEVAAAIAASLDDPNTCARIAGRSAPPPPPRWQRAAIELVRERLVRARSLSEAGRYPDALAVVQGAVADADKTQWAPLKAEALLELARTQSEMDDASVALATATEAALSAEGARHDEVAAQAWLVAMRVASEQLGRTDQSRDLERHARAAVQRLGGDELLAAHLENSSANLLLHEGKLVQAEEGCRHALALYESTGRRDQFYTWLLNDEARALNLLGRVDESVQLFQRAAGEKLRLLGPKHPDYGQALDNLGSTLTDLGRYDEAQKCLEGAERIFRGTLKPGHLLITAVEINFGDLAYARGNYPEARNRYESALKNGDWKGRDAHSYALLALTGLSRTRLAQGERGEAVRLLEEALSSGRPFDAVDRAAAQFVLARAQLADGRDPRAARALAEQARATYASTGSSGKALAEMDSWLLQHP